MAEPFQIIFPAIPLTPQPALSPAGKMHEFRLSLEFIALFLLKPGD